MVSGRSESKALTALKDERDNFESLFQSKAEECAELAKANAALKAQVHHTNSCIYTAYISTCIYMYMYVCVLHHYDQPPPLSLQLGEQRKRASSSSCEEEKTLAPGTTLRPTTPTEDRSLRASLSLEDIRVLEGLRDQLKSFCLMADHLKLVPGALTYATDFIATHPLYTSPDLACQHQIGCVPSPPPPPATPPALPSIPPSVEALRTMPSSP